MVADDFWEEVRPEEPAGDSWRGAEAAAGENDGWIGGQAATGRQGPPERRERPTRSLIEIQAGRWTREMEANFRRHAAFLGYPVKPFLWPDGEVW